MSLDAVPSGIKPDEVGDFLRQQPGVAAIHDLHIWPMSTTETALTCHFLMPGGHPGGEFLVQLAHHTSVSVLATRRFRSSRMSTLSARSKQITKFRAV
jgi:Co/Zn/Cd efflux system component